MKRIMCVGKEGPDFRPDFGLDPELARRVVGERTILKPDRRYKTGFRTERQAIVKTSILGAALWDAGWRPK